METQVYKINYLDKEEVITKFFAESDEIYNDRLEVL